MNEIEYTIQRICARRGVALSKIESVAANFRINFGLASGTSLLPAVGNTFYFLTTVQHNAITIFTNAPALRFTANGTAGGSGGNLDYSVYGGAVGSSFVIDNIETESVIYQVSTWTAGNFLLLINGFKVTYS